MEAELTWWALSFIYKSYISNDTNEMFNIESSSFRVDEMFQIQKAQRCIQLNYSQREAVELWHILRTDE